MFVIYTGLARSNLNKNKKNKNHFNLITVSLQLGCFLSIHFVREVTVLSTYRVSYRVWENLHFLLLFMLTDGPVGQKPDCKDCRLAGGGLG